ncbi:AB hydrolase-1 domain-containing protein [Sphingomonas antarctica]|uniref:alpha/beta fold hydrolase BchO n=1 Tax=Sphingomonas antarctica TaxID=2040274 RepID=UPI0039EA78DE
MTTAPRWAVEGRNWPNREHSRFVMSGGLRWHVQEFASQRQGAPTLLLLHGTGAATHSWRALGPRLAEHFSIIAPDLPGHGFTTGRANGGLSMTGMARAVSGLMQTLAVEPQMIAGHSAGAAIAVRMTVEGLAAPQAIIGLSAALLPFPGLAAKLFPVLARALFVNPIAPHIFARMARTPGETARFLARSTGSQIDAAGIACYEALFATSGQCAGALTMMAEWDLAALERKLAQLATPLLLIHGENDAAIPIANARQAAAIVSDGRLTALPGLGHLAHEEQPDQVAALIESFWSKRR